MSEFLLVNKSGGPTSHDVIDELRKITGERKIGHAGTLDPFASGLLLVAIGCESTKQISKFVKLDKEYIATLKLGAVSDTCDRTGIIKTLKHKNIKAIKKEDVEKVLDKFIGEQEQVPPMFSAKKVKGKKLYELARQGIEIERKASKIKIYDIKIINPSVPHFKKSEEHLPSRLPKPGNGGGQVKRGGQLVLKVKCSSGTYIRSLVHDIGQELGCGAYLQELVRTKIGDFKLENAVSLNKLSKDNWRDFCLQNEQINVR